MLSNKYTIIVGVHLFLIKDGSILLTRRFNTGYEDGNYGVPAGHLEADETLMMGVMREAKEEVGIDLSLHDLKMVHAMHRYNAPYQRNTLDFFITSSLWSGEIFNNEPHKCDEVAWYPLNNLPSDVIPYIKSALEVMQKGEVYSEFGWGR